MSSKNCADFLLKVENMHVHYGNIHALHGVSLEICPNEIVSVVGANGAGKSTLMWAIMGVLPCTSGRRCLKGIPLPSQPHEVVKLGVSLVPERRRLFTSLTVRENLVMGAVLRTDKEEIEADMERCFSLYPVLKDRFFQRSGTLSGGEQQMLAIARALMGRPSLLLLDEPSLGLAPLIVDELFDTLKQIREEGTTILLVEQNALRALEAADRGYVIQSGEIVQEGLGSQLSEDPQVLKAYLG